MDRNELKIAARILRIALALAEDGSPRTASRKRTAGYIWNEPPEKWFTDFDGYDPYSNDVDNANVIFSRRIGPFAYVNSKFDTRRDYEDSMALAKSAYEAVIGPARPLLKKLAGMPDSLIQACAYLRDALGTGYIDRIRDNDNYNPFKFRDDKTMAEFKKKYGGAPSKERIDQEYKKAYAVVDEWMVLVDQIMSMMNATAVSGRVKKAVGQGVMSKLNPFNSKKVDPDGMGKKVEEFFGEWKKWMMEYRDPKDYVDSQYKALSNGFGQERAARRRLTRRLKA